MEQEISPKKVKKAPALKDIACCNENVPDKSRSSGSGSVESKQTKEVSGEQGVAEEAAEQQPVMGPATLESLEARDDFKRQLEAIMDATKVLTNYNSTGVPFMLHRSSLAIRGLNLALFLYREKEDEKAGDTHPLAVQLTLHTARQETV